MMTINKQPAKHKHDTNKDLFRVIVAGGRDFENYGLLRDKLDKYLNKVAQTHEVVIVSGAARGADRLAETYAAERDYHLWRCPANWDEYGKRAGYIRNVFMSRQADAVVAFWDGKSRGTAHMIDTAKKNNLKLRVVYYNLSQTDTETETN